MPIWSVALFGSRARGDHEQSSDTDLLLVTSEPRPRHVSANNMSLSLYPARHLLNKARQGDLFVYHLVNEAKVLHDERGDFDKVKKAFRLKESYKDETQKASDLGWFLVRHGRDFVEPYTLNRRIAWVVRTILIAQAAEAGRPIFSVEALESFSGDHMVRDLIQKKSDTDLNRKALENFTDFLEARGTSDIASSDYAPSSYLQHFLKTGNEVAVQTFKSGFEISMSLYSP